MRVLIFVASWSIAFSAIGQQHIGISQYMLNPYFFNPSYASPDEKITVSFLHRSQWAGYKDYSGNDGAPQIQLFSAGINLDSSAHSFGLLMAREKIAMLTSLQAQVSYAYNVRFSKKSNLALGVRAGIVTWSVSDDYIVKHPDDILIPDGRQAETKPDVTLGMWYGHERFYVGLSAKGVVIQGGHESIGIENKKTFIATGGFNIPVNNEWTIAPSFQLTYTSQSYMQASTMAHYADMFWLGLSYNHQESAALLAGCAMLGKKLRVNYCYDHVTDNRPVKTNASHEVMITYRVGRKSS